MINVQFPAPQFRIQKRGERQYIFDQIRRRWLLLTEEEWVRQNVVAYILVTLHYPKEFISLEKKILVNEMPRRFDILIYNSHHKPWMMVECKAPSVNLNETVLQQVLNYHLAVPVEWIVITNAKNTIAWKKEENQMVIKRNLPKW